MLTMADPKPIAPAPDSLTQEQFYGLLQRLHGNPDKAALLYEELRWKLVKFFQWSSCSFPEDLADETLNRVARKLYAGNQEILEIEAFVWGVAKRIRQEGQKKDFKTIHLSEVDDSLASDIGASVEAINRKLQAQKELRCLRQCLGRLPAEQQQLFLAYRVNQAHYAETRKKLAARFGITSGALRIRIIRLREKLEECMARCMGADQ